MLSLIFRRQLTDMFKLFLSGKPSQARNLRFKMGSFELESKYEEQIREKIIDIAQEPDLEKRLQMAKEPILLDEAIKQIDKQTFFVLEKLANSSAPYASVVNWYTPIFEGADSSTLKRLGDLGLIRYPGYWAEGDEIVWITPRGIELLKRLKHDPNFNA